MLVSVNTTCYYRVGMNKLLQYALTGLLLLAPAGMAVQLSDLSPSIDRQGADDNLTKDYAYRVLSDLSVRRIWNLYRKAEGMSIFSSAYHFCFWAVRAVRRRI